MVFSKEEKSKALLDNHYNWPAHYVFRFIVNKEHKEELLGLLKGFKIVERLSSKKKYVSINAKVYIHTSDEVMDLYSKASKIKTIVML